MSFTNTAIVRGSCPRQASCMQWTAVQVKQAAPALKREYLWLAASSPPCGKLISLFSILHLFPYRFASWSTSFCWCTSSYQKSQKAIPFPEFASKWMLSLRRLLTFHLLALGCGMRFFVHFMLTPIKSLLFARRENLSWKLSCLCLWPYIYIVYIRMDTERKEFLRAAVWSVLQTWWNPSSAYAADSGVWLHILVRWGGSTRCCMVVRSLFLPAWAHQKAEQSWLGEDRDEGMWRHSSLQSVWRVFRLQSVCCSLFLSSPSTPSTLPVPLPPLVLLPSNLCFILNSSHHFSPLF